MILTKNQKQKFRDEVIKEFLAEKNKANESDLIELAGIDSTGMKWYQPKKEVNLPIQRYREQEKYISILASQVSRDNLIMLCNEGLKCVRQAIVSDKKEDAWAPVGAIFTEIKDREQIYAPDMIINVVACQLIREDEEFNPEQIDGKIHQSKCDQLQIESDSGSDFFFQLRDIKKFSDLLNPSEATWTEYAQNYQTKMKEYSEIIKTFSSSNS